MKMIGDLKSVINDRLALTKHSLTALKHLNYSHSISCLARAKGKA